MSETTKPGTENMALTRKRRKKKLLGSVVRVLIALLIIAVLAVGGLIVYRQMHAGTAVTYQQYTASQGTISNALSFSGSLQLIDNATYTADAAGEVRTVYVKEGEDVQAGQKLLRLSTGQTVEAEFAGRVNQLLVEAGAEVIQGDSLIQVADFSRMKVSIRVDEYDISDVQVGQSCRVTVTATEQSLDSSIASINYISASSGNVAYYTATAYVDAPQGIYPGMQTTISIPQEEAKDVVVLKLDAISFDEANQAYVLMKDAEGNMQRVSITTGVSNGNYVEITSGLSAGDAVFTVAEADEKSTSLFDGLFNFGGGQMPAQNNRMMPGAGQMNNFDRTERTFTRPGGNQGGGNR